MKEKLQVWIARLLPDWLVMRAAIRLMAYATTGKYSSTVVPYLTAVEAIRRWDIKDQPLPPNN